MRSMFTDTGLVGEPAGAIGLAAILENKIDPVGKTICIILSGRNVDPESFSKIFSSENISG